MLILSLFDFSGVMLLPWAESPGHTCVAVDQLHPKGLNSPSNAAHPSIITLRADLSLPHPTLDPIIHQLVATASIIFAFPPCTDLATVGAAHFASKGPDRIAAAMALFLQAHTLASQAPIWLIENPVTIMTTRWRRPDHRFHPYYFSGYLPATHTSPTGIIPNRDLYSKRTCVWSSPSLIWSSPSLIWPPDRVAPDPGIIPSFNDTPQNRKFGGSSSYERAMTSQIRSRTPEGFARAIYESNHLNPLLR